MSSLREEKIQPVKKLEDERQNLVRVTDILSELTRQLGPLEKQSETAKIYLAKRETLKELDVNMFLLEYAATAREPERAGRASTDWHRSSWRIPRKPMNRPGWNMTVWNRNWRNLSSRMDAPAHGESGAGFAQAAAGRPDQCPE